MFGESRTYFGESRIDKNRGLAKLGSTISLLIGSSDPRFPYLLEARIDDSPIFLMPMLEHHSNLVQIIDVFLLFEA